MVHGRKIHLGQRSVQRRDICIRAVKLCVLRGLVRRRGGCILGLGTFFGGRQRRCSLLPFDRAVLVQRQMVKASRDVEAVIIDRTQVDAAPPVSRQLFPRATDTLSPSHDAVAPRSRGRVRGWFGCWSFRPVWARPSLCLCRRAPRGRRRGSCSRRQVVCGVQPKALPAEFCRLPRLFPHLCFQLAVENSSNVSTRVHHRLEHCCQLLVDLSKQRPVLFLQRVASHCHRRQFGRTRRRVAQPQAFVNLLQHLDQLRFRAVRSLEVMTSSVRLLACQRRTDTRAPRREETTDGDEISGVEGRGPQNSVLGDDFRRLLRAWGVHRLFRSWLFPSTPLRMPRCLTVD